MKFSKYIIIGGIALSMGFTSCVDDLDVSPENPTTKLELTTAEDYYALMARVYGGLVLEGGIAVDDGGAGVYTRQLWNVQELPSDEAIVGYNWNDAGIQELGFSTWSSDNHWLYECFSRFNYQIALCNEFLRTIGNASGLIAEDEINTLRCEARVLRDLSYYHMIDIFGRGPWTDENSVVGATPPTYDRKQLFDAVVADLLAAVPGLRPASQQVYGRISREAGYMLLVKIYLNAEVYTGQGMWQQCADACNEILKTINQLAPEYKYLFCATNDKYVGNGEILWGIPQDTNTLHTYGGTTYISGGAYNAEVAVDKPYGCGVDGWGGPRVRPELSQALAKNDKRRLIYEGSFNENLHNLDSWTKDGDGYMCVKFVYTPEDNYDNADGSSTTSTVFNSTDFPLFRLADTYLMLAECEKHGASNCNGLARLNDVRNRAGLGSVTSYTLDDILTERLRELYWEGHRRSDLVRFGKFAGNAYNWSWKGGVEAGAATQSYRNVCCIPAQYVPTLGQNPGY